MALEQINDTQWTLTDWHKMSPGVHFPVRTMIVRLADGTLWLHSPVALSDEVAAQIDALGPVGHIVAPNALHHLYLKDAARRWPQASVWHAPGVVVKRKDMELTNPLRSGQTWGDAEITCLEIAGNDWAQEHVFLAGKSLLLTDLVFHMKQTRGWLTPLVLRMAGTHGGKLAQSRLIRPSTKDRPAAAASCREMLSWEFDRVFMAHGDPVEGADAAERLEQALWWMLSASPVPEHTAA